MSYCQSLKSSKVRKFSTIKESKRHHNLCYLYTTLDWGRRGTRVGGTSVKERIRFKFNLLAKILKLNPGDFDSASGPTKE